MTSVRIVDYGLGNLHSVLRALSRWTNDVSIVDRGEEIASASHLVLPGVGAFGAAMSGIRERDLQPALKSFALSGKPMIGLCVGMQILADTGQENGMHAGLSLIPGSVVSLKQKSPSSIVPNIGWRDVRCSMSDSKKLFPGAFDQTYYFAHSFEFIPEEKSHIAATTDFDGRQVVAAVHSENIIGLQFHPEKSAEAGLQLLKRFLDMP